MLMMGMILASTYNAPSLKVEDTNHHRSDDFM